MYSILERTLIPDAARELALDVGFSLDVGLMAKSGLWFLKYVRGYSSSSASNQLLFLRQAKLDFAPTVFLDGQLYPKDKLMLLADYLYKRGVDVNITGRSPAFQARNPITGKPALYFTQNPTVL